MKTPGDAATSVGVHSAPPDVACGILGFCGWRDRAAMRALNKHWHENVFSDDATWRAMCEFLHREEFVYSSPVCTAGSWRDLFAEKWLLRARWTKPEGPPDKIVYTVAEKLKRERAGETGLIIQPAWKKPTESYSFNISVVVRLRPQREASGEEEPEAQEVVLPLHQRVALIRKQKKCSKEEAFALLFGGADGDFFDGATLAEGSEDAKPAEKDSAAEPAAPSPEEADKETPAESAATAAGVVSVDPKEIVMCAPGIGMRPFTCFDSVLCDTASQAAVYESVARKQVGDFINGLNCTIFCYGQTGSGKTHTLFGKDSDAATTITHTSAASGVVPRACAEISSAVSMRAGFMDGCKLEMSYVEVYGEEVSDLLSQKKSTVGAWRGTAVRAVLDGTTRVTIVDAEHMQSLLLQGESAKRRAATAMNERSSRAHALLILTLTQNAGNMESVSHLCLADLGGSEQLSKSGATGVRMQEAIGINTGLLALKQCIRALNNQATHVPYHDSKLTQLLSSALGGNSKTTVVVTASPEPRHATESLQALRFGEACAVVTNAADAQQSSVAHLIAELDAKIAATEALIEKNERWERFEETMPMDEFGDGGGIRTRMKLVGAEKERETLELCLKKRRALLGEPEPDPAAQKKAALAEQARKPDFDVLPEPSGDLAQSEAAFRDQFNPESENHHGGDSTPADEPQETPAEKKARLMKEKMAKKQAARLEKAQKMKEERRAAAVAKAAEREKRAAKRKAEMLEATKERARQQQERLKKQMERTRRAREAQKDPCEAQREEQLAVVEKELAESIKTSGTEHQLSVELAKKAEWLRAEIKKHQDKGEDAAVGGVEGRARAAAEATSTLSEEERQLLEAHSAQRTLVSDNQRATEQCMSENSQEGAGEAPEGEGTYTEVQSKSGNVAGAVGSGWAVLEERSNEDAMLRANGGDSMPAISE